MTTIRMTSIIKWHKGNIKLFNVYPCSADDPAAKRDNCTSTSEGTDRVQTEVLNIVACVNNGVIPDFEI